MASPCGWRARRCSASTASSPPASGGAEQTAERSVRRPAPGCGCGPVVTEEAGEPAAAADRAQASFHGVALVARGHDEQVVAFEQSRVAAGHEPLAAAHDER